MRRALELARQGMGFTSPNPCVGAVIVKGGKIVAEGWHARAGDDHAEVVAIKEMMKKSGIVTVDIEPALFQNATLYVTLEPCCHRGKTPPCVSVLVKAGFQRVVIGMKDPFPKVNGKGVSFLKKHGIRVSLVKEGSVLHREIRVLNQSFIKSVTTGLPYVTMKAALSLDGKIATSTGDSKWITAKKTRMDARIERSYCDAVLVGSGTVLADNPELAVLSEFRGKKFLRVVVDNKLLLKTNLKVFRDENVLVACSMVATSKNKKRFDDAGIKFRSFGSQRVSMKKLLKYLGTLNIQSVFLEGGSGINGVLFEENLEAGNLIDRVLFYFAPKIIGGQNSLSVIGGMGMEKISKSIKVNSVKTQFIGDDLKYEGLLNFY